MTTVNTDEIHPGDEVRVAGSWRWLHVIDVHPQGVHVLADWHAWHKWNRIAAHRSAETGGGRS